MYICVCKRFVFSVLTEGEKPETKQKRLEAKYAALQIVPNVDKLGTAKVSVHEIDTFARLI